MLWLSFFSIVIEPAILSRKELQNSITDNGIIKYKGQRLASISYVEIKFRFCSLFSFSEIHQCNVLLYIYIYIYNTSQSWIFISCMNMNIMCIYMQMRWPDDLLSMVCMLLTSNKGRKMKYDLEQMLQDDEGRQFSLLIHCLYILL